MRLLGKVIPSPFLIDSKIERVKSRENSWVMAD
jgi:hypothetical protein